MSTGDVSEAVEPAFYKWVCPVCNDARGSRAADADRARREGERALRVHVRMTEGAGHGDRFEFPPDVDPDSLGEFVQVSVDR